MNVPETRGNGLRSEADELSAADLAVLWDLARRLPGCDSVGEAEAVAAAAVASSSGGVALRRAVAETVASARASIHERERLHSLAIRDPLTGLFNRGFMEEEVVRQIHRLRPAGRPLALAMLDLDHFRSVNERFGHLAGDQVLRSLAVLLQGFRQGNDIPCRYGGEEFAVIMPDLTAAAAALRLDPLLSQLAETEIHAEGRRLDPVTASIGVAEFPLHGTTFTSLVTAADTALYRAKQAGRNRICTAGDDRERGPR